MLELLTTDDLRFIDKSKVVRLLANWVSVVTEIERGYNHTLDEYDNDVWDRHSLEEALQSVPPETAGPLRAALSDTDKQFIAATRPADRPYWRQEWYFQRLPRKPGRELAEDFKFR